MTHTLPILSPASGAQTTARAVCPYCGVGCSITATVRDNQIQSITADPDLAPNFGALCSKGSLLGTPRIHSAGRLAQPMIRLAKSQPLQPVSWDQAASFIADRLQSIQSLHGRDSVAWYGSGQLDTEASYVFTKLFKGFLQTNNADTNSRLCMASAATAYTASLGSDGPSTCYDDIDHADVFLILGANMASNHPVLFNRVRRRKQAHPQCRVIVVDPRRTATADLADIFVPVAPGGDVALIHLIARRLLDSNHIDHAFVEQHTHGFADYQESLQSLDTDALLRESGVDNAVIDQVVAALQTPSRLLTFYCMGANQSTSGVDKNLALIHLHLQLGQIAKPGAGPFSLTGQPNAMGGREAGYLSHQLPGYRFVADPVHRTQMEAAWEIPAGSISSSVGLHAVPMFEALAAGRVKALWVACSNPAVSMPNTNVVKAALSKAQLLIVQDCYHPTETSAYADVLLPAAQWGEKSGTMTNSERLVARSQQFLTPIGDAMPDWWIAARVARAMGFKGFDYQSNDEIWTEFTQVTADRPCDMSGITNANLVAGPMHWPCKAGEKTGSARRYSDGKFFTSDGRARFETLSFRAPDETLSSEFPFVITTGRVASQWHTRTRTGRVPELNRLEPEPFIEVHPSDAAVLGLREGHFAKVIGRRGQAVGRVRVTDRIRPGTLFMPFHWGDLYHPESAANYVTNPAFDARSKQPEFKYAAVNLVPLHKPAFPTTRDSTSFSKPPDQRSDSKTAPIQTGSGAL